MGALFMSIKPASAPNDRNGWKVDIRWYPNTLRTRAKAQKKGAVVAAPPQRLTIAMKKSAETPAAKAKRVKRIGRQIEEHLEVQAKEPHPVQELVS